MKLKIYDKKDKSINAGMIGLFFEDINYGLDGGLHAEMLENRSYEFVKAYGNDKKYETEFAGDYGWSIYSENNVGSILSIESVEPLNTTNPHYIVFSTKETKQSFTNKAYEGIFMKPGLEYKVSFYAKSTSYEGDVIVSVIKDHEVLASSRVAALKKNGWNRYETSLVAKKIVSYGDFVITLVNKGMVCFDAFSMKPIDAVCGLFRRDLVEKLIEMKPGFLRFPGGCVVEGANLSNRYQWKEGINSWEQRKTNWNRWAVHDNSYQEGEKIRYCYYNQSLGIGYYEYFLLSEYLGAKPLPVMNVGLACQYQSDEKVPINDSTFFEYIQDTLDLIEFANGDSSTKWGQERIRMGHSESFGLELIAIGNEQWESQEIDFFERYRMFEKEIHERYPEIKLIGSAGPDITSDKYIAAWEFYNKEIEKNPNFVYAVDEHYYMHPDWFKKNVHFYDSYNRRIKVFAGEYAAHYDNGMNRPELNNWGASLAEAAFMTGLERNADVVQLASYAPLFARKNYTQWSPDMIWFDGEHSYNTPNYYVQQLFSLYKGTDTLITEIDKEEVYCSVSANENSKEIFIKLVNITEEAKCVCLSPEFEVRTEAICIQIQGELTQVNSLDNPYNLVPRKRNLMFTDDMNYFLEPYSLHVIVLLKK